MPNVTSERLFMYQKNLRCALIQIGLQGGRHINLFVFKPLKAYMFIKVLLNLTFINYRQMSLRRFQTLLERDSNATKMGFDCLESWRNCLMILG